ncbi:F-box domain containing protein [Tanacetum coccineum]
MSCQNLKNLTLERCQVFEPQDFDGFTINNSQLLSLTLTKVEWNNVYFVYVDTPQLKNLIFVDTPQPENRFSRKLAISARDLTFLRIKASYFPNLSLYGGFPSLEKVDLCISYPQKKNVHRIFQCLHSVKSLALSLEIVELLSTSDQLISHQPSPFPSLKSLKIYPSSTNKGLKTLRSCELKNYRLKTSLEILKTQPDEEQEAMKIKLSAQVTNYLRGTSLNATFTLISHEEAKAIKITTVAYRLMAAL